MEQIIVPDPKAAEIKLRKKIASSMNIREEAFTTLILLNFAKKDRTLDKFCEKGKFGAWIFPLDKVIVIKNEKDEKIIRIIDTASIVYLDSVPDPTKAGLNCFYHSSANPIQVCHRCGKLICTQCCRPYFGNYYCKDCDKGEFEIIKALYVRYKGFKEMYYLFGITNRRILLIPCSEFSFGEQWLSYVAGGIIGQMLAEKRIKDAAKKLLSNIDFSKVSKVEGDGFILPLTPSAVTSFLNGCKKMKMVLVEEVLGKLPKIHDTHILTLEEEIRKIAGYCEKLEEEWRIGKITNKIYETLESQYETKLIELHDEYKKKTS